MRMLPFAGCDRLSAGKTWNDRVGLGDLRFGLPCECYLRKFFGDALPASIYIA